MKQQRKTHAITQEEYNLFFSDDITIRQKKKLAKKFVQRLAYFQEVFDNIDIDEDYFDSTYIFQNHYRKQRPTEDLNFTGDYNCSYYIGEDIRSIKVSFLWDDEAVNKIIKETKEYKENQKIKTAKEQEQRRKDRELIMNQFNEREILFILRNLEVFKNW